MFKIDLKDLEFVLGLQGLKVLGTGNFSKVFDIGNEQVLKITVDNVYYDYLKLCQENPKPYLPKAIKDFGSVYSFVNECGNLTNIYAMILPKYISGDDYADELFEAFVETPISDTDARNKAKEAWKSFSRKEGEFDILREFIRYFITDLDTPVLGGLSFLTTGFKMRTEDLKNLMRASVVCGIDPLDLIDFLNKINKFEDFFEDFHEGNIMYDAKTGNFIITDPVGSRKSGCMFSAKVTFCGVTEENAEKISKDFLEYTKTLTGNKSLGKVTLDLAKMQSKAKLRTLECGKSFKVSVVKKRKSFLT